MENKFIITHGLNLHLKIKKLKNDTYIAEIIHPENSNVTKQPAIEPPRDDQGALIYVCAVILFYGFSIILMIASLIKKGMSDKNVVLYRRDSEKLRQLERRQEKFKTRLAMSKKKVRHILGSDRCVMSPSETDGDNFSGEVEVLMENLYTDSTTESYTHPPLVRNHRMNFTRVPIKYSFLQQSQTGYHAKRPRSMGSSNTLLSELSPQGNQDPNYVCDDVFLSNQHIEKSPFSTSFHDKITRGTLKDEKSFDFSSNISMPKLSSEMARKPSHTVLHLQTLLETEDEC